MTRHADPVSIFRIVDESDIRPDLSRYFIQLPCPGRSFLTPAPAYRPLSARSANLLSVIVRFFFIDAAYEWDTFRQLADGEFEWRAGLPEILGHAGSRTKQIAMNNFDSCNRKS